MKSLNTFATFFNMLKKQVSEIWCLKSKCKPALRSIHPCSQREPGHTCSAICCVPHFPRWTLNRFTLDATVSPDKIHIPDVMKVSWVHSWFWLILVAAYSTCKWWQNVCVFAVTHFIWHAMFSWQKCVYEKQIHSHIDVLDLVLDVFALTLS